ncbi:Oidioi.mRNA.OKI2018_I69.chr2.g7607.t1.cds [Oikopleura dioica]|uniref:Oidioi.mRNA.OKI2018_I69.chr2.g7607.t1.cds n=1 Tax=Oikopleura dioica TaxID=34765 RepID=A0ABN7TD53_OIKDI|nr:Oidioi.mRNA.OKI2018_I69.chr2.g7607.t1.cds [Oikopleura dioica]
MFNSQTSTSPASTNRQLQALEGTYKSSKQYDQQKKIIEGTRKLMQRMPSETSEFSDGEDAQPSQDRMTRKMRKFERKALETTEEHVNLENPPRVIDIKNDQKTDESIEELEKPDENAVILAMVDEKMDLMLARFEKREKERKRQEAQQKNVLTEFGNVPDKFRKCHFNLASKPS